VLRVTDDPGVMGNLPRSRPGRRSEKRAAEVKPPSAAGGGAKGGAKAARSRAKTAGSAKSAGPKKAAAAKKGTARAKPRTTGARAGGPAPTTPSAVGRGGQRAPRTSVRDERVETAQGQDPITAAIRLGMSVGDAGLKVVAKLAQRLPRP
jgi:hypothetical protein